MSYESLSDEQVETALCVKPSAQPSQGKKFDAGKPRWDLLPWEGLSEVVDVLTFGAEKYGPNNWQLVDNHQARYTAAALRHMSAYCKGEQDDPESGMHHLAHAICCLLFLLDQHERTNP